MKTVTSGICCRATSHSNPDGCSQTRVFTADCQARRIRIPVMRPCMGPVSRRSDHCRVARTTSDSQSEERNPFCFPRHRPPSGVASLALRSQARWPRFHSVRSRSPHPRPRPIRPCQRFRTYRTRFRCRAPISTVRIEVTGTDQAIGTAALTTTITVAPTISTMARGSPGSRPPCHRPARLADQSQVVRQSTGHPLHSEGVACVFVNYRLEIRPCPQSSCASRRLRSARRPPGSCRRAYAPATCRTAPDPWPAAGSRNRSAATAAPGCHRSTSGRS